MATRRGTSRSARLKGTAATDQLPGLAGDDQLSDAAGNDRLDGGTGTDRTSGGRGDALCVVDNTRDRVIERAGEGADSVRASVLVDAAGEVVVETAPAVLLAFSLDDGQGGAALVNPGTATQNAAIASVLPWTASEADSRLAAGLVATRCRTAAAPSAPPGSTTARPSS